MQTQIKDSEKLDFHLQQVMQNQRRFENAAQGVSRMILGEGVTKHARAGQTVYEFNFFRQGAKHIIGWFQETNDFVNFVEDAARGGPSKELAFVLIGEPGNGKTFFVQYICDRYLQFLAQPQNRRYTFEFINLEELRTYGGIKVIQSQTFEDPVVFAMNLFELEDECKEFLSRLGFDDAQIDGLYSRYRPFGACTDFIWNDIRSHCGGDIQKMLQFIRIVPIRIPKQSGTTIATKYSAGDKITSSAIDLRGDEDLKRQLVLDDTSNPYRYDLRIGCLARSGGGGVHFSDEIFKNKIDFVNIYLQVIQNRNIELAGYLWPIDSLILATSNNEEYNRFTSEGGQAPIKDRCHLCYVTHNTDYKLQQELTRYVIGSDSKFTVTGKNIHEDPNLNYAVSVAVTLTRLPHTDKLTPIETMKLEAGEVVAEKSVKTLIELKESANANPDVTKRWGQKGVGHRGLGRTVQSMLSMPETHEGGCRFALDCFKAAEREVLDYTPQAIDRDKCMKDFKIARGLYRARIKTSIFNAFRNDPDAIRKDVKEYINMIIGIISDDLGPDRMWKYRDPQTGELKAIKIDQRYIDSVETRLGLTTKERKEAFRNSMRNLYGQKITTVLNYDFMDNEPLVKAVTDVRLESDVAGASSLMGALSNRTDEENLQLYNRMIQTMLEKLGYCMTCAEKTIEYYCTKVDEN